MRQWGDIVDYVPLLIGTLVGDGSTAIGNAVPVEGFADMMGILTWAVVGGTEADQSQLSVSIQEAAYCGTVSSYAEIRDGAVMGTVKITTCHGTAPTYPFLASTTFYERLADGKRLRWIRPIASCAGTAGVNFVFTFGVMLGRPRNSMYIRQNTIHSTYYDEFSLPKWEGA